MNTPATDAADLIRINLKVVAGLKESDRLVTHTPSFEVHEAGWGQTLSRRWNGDTRWTNFAEVKKLVDGALCMLNLYCAHIVSGTSQHSAPPPPRGVAPSTASAEIAAAAAAADAGGSVQQQTQPPALVAAPVVTLPDPPGKLAADLMRELVASLVGMGTMKSTYAGDARMLANLDVMMQKIQCEVDKAEALLRTAAEQHVHQPSQPPLPSPPLTRLSMAAHLTSLHSTSALAVAAMSGCALPAGGGGGGGGGDSSSGTGRGARSGKPPAR
jgi:hypothetical protein